MCNFFRYVVYALDGKPNRPEHIHRLSIYTLASVCLFVFCSIDNLRMRGCFEPNNQITAVNGKCQSTDVKCTVNKVEVCISQVKQCDITNDCDNKEDEMVNCGE